MTFKVKDGLQVGSTLAIDANGKLTTSLSTPRTITLSGDVSGSASFDGSANITITTTNTANSIALGTDTTGNYMVNVAAGGGISVSHTQGEGSTATVSHADTSSQASVDNSNGVVIQDVTLDTYGHITGLASVDLDGRYYTESEADSRFVNVTGDTMTGTLTAPTLAATTSMSVNGTLQFNHDQMWRVGAPLHIQHSSAYNTYINCSLGGNVGIGSDSASQKLHVHGTGYATSDFRAPIFYDSDNTSYYVDPASSLDSAVYINGGIKQNGGRYVRDSFHKSVSGQASRYSSGTAGWNTVAKIRLTGTCTGDTIYGTIYDNAYHHAVALQVAIVARAECDFTTNNESHTIEVGCTVIGGSDYSNYRDKIRVELVESSTNLRVYELQVYETAWNDDRYELSSRSNNSGSDNSWVIYTSGQAPGTSTGTSRVTYRSVLGADSLYANTAIYTPIYYDKNNTGYYVDPASTSLLNDVRAAIFYKNNDTNCWINIKDGSNNTHIRNNVGGIYHDAGHHHFRDAAGSEWSYLNSDYFSHSSDIRAPIFYDSNDTAAYWDGAGGNGRMGRDLYISGWTGGNYGNRLVVGNTDTTYTLQDTNLRPTIQAHGAYPVLSLNHTVTSNGSHGPTVQFTSNGTGYQFVIGTNGTGTQLDIGTSNNTSWNPHNGIAGYNGTTGWRMDTSGNVFNFISTRTPITYDYNDTAWYTDPASTSRMRNIDVCSGTNTANYYDAAIEVREYNMGGAQTDNWQTAPRIGFHWGGRVASSIAMGSNGWIAIMNNPGTGYENFIAANIYATGNVTAYYSDERLKTKVGVIENALDKVLSIETFMYVNNDIAKENGFTGDETQVGVSAQSVEKVLPEVVKHAPFDIQSLDGEEISKSGEWYKTVQYDRLVPLLIEAIKEQQAQIEELKSLLNK